MKKGRPIRSQVTVPGHGQSRLELLQTVKTLLTDLDWPAEDIFSVQLAVEEAVANAYHHGNLEGQRGDVEIRWEISDTDFMMA